MITVDLTVLVRFAYPSEDKLSKIANNELMLIPGIQEPSFIFQKKQPRTDVTLYLSSPIEKRDPLLSVGDYQETFRLLASSEYFGDFFQWRRAIEQIIADPNEKLKDWTETDFLTLDKFTLIVPVQLSAGAVGRTIDYKGEYITLIIDLPGNHLEWEMMRWGTSEDLTSALFSRLRNQAGITD